MDDSSKHFRPSSPFTESKKLLPSPRADSPFERHTLLKSKNEHFSLFAEDEDAIYNSNKSMNRGIQR